MTTPAPERKVVERKVLCASHETTGYTRCTHFAGTVFPDLEGWRIVAERLEAEPTMLELAARDLEEARANARLIAEATAMREALEAILLDWDEVGDFKSYVKSDRELFEKARSILARVPEGGSKEALADGKGGK
jgi:hypothetical protein